MCKVRDLDRGLQEALQRLEARAELQGKTGSGERMSRFASEPALAAERSEPSGGRMKAFLSAGSPRVAAAAAPGTESPDGSDADAGRSLVFKESPTSDDRCCARSTYYCFACNHV